MDKVQALTSFWNSFGLKAYDVSSVPDNAVMPYMTFEVATDSFGNEVAITNSLWYNSTSWAAISQKAEEISSAVGMCGKTLRYDDGGMWIKRATPFAQRLSTDSDTIKRIVLNFSIEFISNN